MPVPRRRVLAVCAGAFGIAAAAYLTVPDKSRHAPTVDDAELSPSHFTRATLTSSETSGPDTKLLVLTVPGFSKLKIPPFAMPIWSVCIKDDDIQVERAYTPLRGIDDAGRMEFWVKRYPRGEVGRWLHSKHVGDTVEFRGPLTTWAWKDGAHWDEIVMISGGTGVTPFFQLLHSAFSGDAPSNTRFTLLHSSRTPADLPPPAILGPLRAYSATHPERFSLHLFVDDAPGESVPADTRVGRINRKHIEHGLGGSGWFWPWMKRPPPKRTLFLVCGPEPMVAALAGPYGRNLSQGEVGGVLKELDQPGSPDGDPHDHPLCRPCQERFGCAYLFLAYSFPVLSVDLGSMAEDGFGFDDVLDVTLTDEEWDRYLDHKRRWCRWQPLIESKGYKIADDLNPDRVDTFKERPKGPVEEPLYPHLLVGTRMWDKRPVMLKLSRTDLWEATIFEHLASIPDPDNHTIPFYDLITPPEEPTSEYQWCIIITPRLTDCRNSHLRTVRDLVDFVTQVVEGVCFMHRYNVAHTDVARTNIVWDERPNVPDHVRVEPDSLLLRWFKKKPPVVRKYWFIDFGLACSFSSYESRGLVKGLCGQHRNIPELSEEVAYDPFPLDIRQIGEMLNRDYLALYKGAQFLVPWVARLRHDDPTQRPTATQALAELQHLTSSLSEEKLSSRIYKHGDWPYLARNTAFVLLVWFILNGLSREITRDKRVLHISPPRGSQYSQSHSAPEGLFRKNAIDGPQVDVDEIPVQATGEILLYFVCTNSLPLRFPDLSSLIERSPTETDDEQTPRCDSTFRARIQARDGSCISSQRIADDSDAQACHCIPFVKGTAYLRGLNRYLQVTTDAVSGIDDTRNGLLLVANVHKKWADHALGLLLVPNELLLLEQIPPSAVDNFSNPLPTPPTQCLVVHHLKTLPSATHRTVPPNCIARYETTNEAVPAYLLDYVYVSQILINFGKHWVLTYSVEVEVNLMEEGTTELGSLPKRDANPRRPSGLDCAWNANGSPFAGMAARFGLSLKASNESFVANITSCC
uniref:NADH-cytochrome B5 reductase n=1 Tax=Mycena chlorophos TaxID=658473 RepID=A0ABQ0LS48_MYCCL|nr:NADH-cytochrome B5 reductase [Mycena chlorophos]